jgi:PTS system fructose-specific IIA component/PTS system nitrogen regulatory IIA component
MCDFVVRDAILPELAVASKEGVIRALVESLCAAGRLRWEDLEEVVHAVREREALGTTAIGRGVAVPHAKHRSVDCVTGTVAVSHDGVAFASLDGQPVHLLVLVLSPLDRPGDHLRALESVFRCLHDGPLVRDLRSATTREAIGALLDQTAQDSRSEAGVLVGANVAAGRRTGG